MLCCAASAQKASVAIPDRLVVARDEFWDFGPPFNYYDLIQIKSVGDDLALDQVLVTPHGQACVQPAKVEERTVTVHQTMPELLDGKNPCAIPKKELHKELKRCRHCLTFSGVIVNLQADCGGGERQIRMDVLDRDIYDPRSATPPNTSWTMSLMSRLNELLGPDSSQQPTFPLGAAVHVPVPDTPLVQAIGDGKYDSLFGADRGVSKIVQEARLPPPPPPSVELVSAEPTPVSPELPKYPPIAIVARVEGTVTATFEIDSEGGAQKVMVVDGPKMVQLSVPGTISRWKFPESAWGKSGKVVLRFQLNCH